MGRASALYSKWVCGPKGALSIECQELNALYSDSVDGAPIRIPDRLSNPPRFANSNLKEELILKAGELIKTINEADAAATTDTQPADEIIDQANIEDKDVFDLLRMKSLPFSEFELFNIVRKVCAKWDLDLQQFLPHIDFSAFTIEEKHIYLGYADRRVSEDFSRNIWNR
jgi:hypothetical protein